MLSFCCNTFFVNNAQKLKHQPCHLRCKWNCLLRPSHELLTLPMWLNLERHCSRTLVACWTTCCVKGFLSFNPLAFTHVPPDVTTSKLYENLMFGTSVWHCVYKNLWFISVKKLLTFSNVVGIFLPWKFKLISDNFKLVSQWK
jgi:hypothetical protein